jgi:PPP family 3-phenylpropionic acid transporter
MGRGEFIEKDARQRLALRVYFFASFAALGVYSPFFPRWLVARGIEGVAMGAVVATIPAMGVIGPPLIGLLADSIGLRGSLLRVACIGSFFAFAVLAVAGVADHHLTSFEILAVVLLFAAFRAPMLMMADVVAIEREHEGAGSYGSTRLWGSIGFLVASVGGGRWMDAGSPTALPSMVALSLLVAAVTAFAIPVRSGAVRLSFTDNLHGLSAVTDLPLLLGTAFAGELALSSYELCFSLHLADLGASGTFIGLAWALGIVAEILMMAVAARLIAAFRAPPLVVIALFLAALRCALLAMLRSLPALMAVQLLHSPSVALFWIAAISYLKRRTSQRAFATAQGLLSAVTAAGSVMGMLAWGALYRRVGGAVTFGVAGVVALAAALFAVRWAAVSRKHAAPVREPTGVSP